MSLAPRWKYLGVSPHQARGAHTAVFAGGRLIVWGGIGDQGLPRVDGAAYDCQRNAWTPIPMAPIAPRRGASVQLAAGRLFIWGGFIERPCELLDDSVSALADGAVFDFEEEKWRIAAPSLLRPRGNHFTAAFRDSILLWGGWAGQDHHRHDGAFYEVTHDRWRPIRECPLGPRRYEQRIWRDRRLILWSSSTPTKLQSGTLELVGSPRPVHAVSGRGAPKDVSRASAFDTNPGNLFADDIAIYDAISDAWEVTESPVGLPVVAWATLVANEVAIVASHDGSVTLWSPGAAPCHAPATHCLRPNAKVIGHGNELLAVGTTYDDDVSQILAWRYDVPRRAWQELAPCPVGGRADYSVTSTPWGVVVWGGNGLDPGHPRAYADGALLRL